MSAEKVKPSYWIHSIIAISIMLFFRFIPAPDPVTPYGMALLGIFIGAVWGWCTVSMIWPTLVALTLMGLLGENTVSGIWSSAWGNTNVLFVFFLMIFAELLKYSGLDRFVARWVVSRKISTGKPYLLFSIIFAGTTFTSMVIGPPPSILMFWAITDSLLAELGYTRGDKLSAAVALGVAWCATLGCMMMPFQTTAVINFSLFFAGTGGAITSFSYSAYLLFGVTVGLLALAAWVLYMRFVINPDTTKALNFRAKEYEEALKMNKKQKMATAIFALLVFLLLVPSFFTGSTNAILSFVNKLGNVGSCAICLAILAFVVCDGEPFASVPRLIQQGVVWNLVFMFAAGMTIGTQLTTPLTGITPFLSNLVSPILSSVGSIGYLFIFMAITLVLTNCVNNVPVAAVLLPMQYSICMDLGMNPIAVVACFVFIVDYAIFLPSSSPIGALLHNNDGRISRGEIYKWSGPMLIMQLLVVCVIGYPLASMVF